MNGFPSPNLLSRRAARVEGTSSGFPVRDRRHLLCFRFECPSRTEKNSLIVNTRKLDRNLSLRELISINHEVWTNEEASSFLYKYMQQVWQRRTHLQTPYPGVHLIKPYFKSNTGEFYSCAVQKKKDGGVPAALAMPVRTDLTVDCDGCKHVQRHAVAAGCDIDTAKQ